MGCGPRLKRCSLTGEVPALACKVLPRYPSRGLASQGTASDSTSIDNVHISFLFGVGDPALLFKCFPNLTIGFEPTCFFGFEPNSVTMYVDRNTSKGDPRVPQRIYRTASSRSTYKQMITSDKDVITEKKLRTTSEGQQIVLPVYSLLKFSFKVCRRYYPYKRPE